MSSKVAKDIKCADCGRLLDYDEYKVRLTGKEDPQTVTYIPGAVYQAVQCSTCGHYTVITPKTGN